MSVTVQERAALAQAERMERYYRWHAGIYDATRWAFLFGRTTGLRRLPPDFAPRRILEVGCGTGHNLRRLARRFPEAEIEGVDVSAAMLAEACRQLASAAGRIHLHHGPYRPRAGRPRSDLILFSYCLSMVHPGHEELLDAAAGDLAPGGRLVVVDFHDSPVPAFRRWMGMNHVTMDGTLLSALERRFAAEIRAVRRAYAGLWRYLVFIGTKPQGGAP